MHLKEKQDGLALTLRCNVEMLIEGGAVQIESCKNANFKGGVSRFSSHVNPHEGSSLCRLYCSYQCDRCYKWLQSR